MNKKFLIDRFIFKFTRKWSGGFARRKKFRLCTGRPASRGGFAERLARKGGKNIKAPEKAVQYINSGVKRIFSEALFL
ncbi:MAG TPA: hypothetical protein VF604_19520 [Pyrinomonadaceae bacterium]|jgi:hypothetical protein